MTKSPIWKIGITGRRKPGRPAGGERNTEDMGMKSRIRGTGGTSKRKFPGGGQNTADMKRSPGGEEGNTADTKRNPGEESRDMTHMRTSLPAGKERNMRRMKTKNRAVEDGRP